MSAQVVLRAASGRPLAGATITAGNVHEYAPDPGAVSRVAAALSAIGFEVGPLVANSMSITAPVETFDTVFGVQLHRGASGAITLDSDAGEFELPKKGLPSSVASFVEAVTFTAPPDFGPTRP